jgi:hypothetical protein
MRARALSASVRVSMLATAFSMAGCTPSGVLDDSVPFPCAKDGTCPLLYSCSADAGACVKSEHGVTGTKHVDDACDEGADECDIGTGLCVLAVCAPVSGASDCPAGHPVSYSAACLLDCSKAPCPTGLTCADVRAGTAGSPLAHACIGPKAALEDTPCRDRCGSSVYTCIAGTCVIACDVPTTDCPTGRRCAAPAKDAGPSSQRGCFFDCAPDAGQCPTGTTCAPGTPDSPDGGANACVHGA